MFEQTAILTVCDILDSNSISKNVERYEGTWNSHNMQICIYVKCVCKQLKMLRVSLLCNFHFHHPIIWLIWIGFFLEGNFELICNFANDTHYYANCIFYLVRGNLEIEIKGAPLDDAAADNLT